MSQGHTHTKVEGDQLVDYRVSEKNATTTENMEKAVKWAYKENAVEEGRKHDEGYFVVPGRGHGMRVESLEPRELEFNVGGEKPDVVITPQDDVQVSYREGRKDDEGKDRWDLLPPSIIKVVEVYTIGADIYDDDNWAKGMGYRRIFGAMMRHAWKWFWGESYDQQDGQHHLASVAWACLTLMHYEDEGVGTDDRAFKPLDRPVPPQALGVDGFEDRKPVVPPECEPEELAVESDCTFREYAGYVGINVCPVHGWH